MSHMQTHFKSHFSVFFLFSLLLSGNHFIIAQTSSEIISKAFDQTIGKENLEISNGTVHVNEFRILNNKHNYYPSDAFEKGNITYNNQDYIDLDLKFDIYKDILIYKPQPSDEISINLIKEKIAAFTLNKRKFVYLNQLLHPLSPINTGYYEENFIGKKFAFYIKHHRDKRDVYKESSIFQEFDDNYEYYIKKDGAFYTITSKKDIIKLFPNHKRKINDFYAAFRKTEKENEPMFYEKLMVYLNNSLEYTQD